MRSSNSEECFFLGYRAGGGGSPPVADPIAHHVIQNPILRRLRLLRQWDKRSLENDPLE